MSKLYRCESCARYTMSKHCPACGGATELAKPPKYSPEDRWGMYRRKAKDEQAH